MLTKKKSPFGLNTLMLIKYNKKAFENYCLYAIAAQREGLQEVLEDIAKNTDNEYSGEQARRKEKEKMDEESDSSGSDSVGDFIHPHERAARRLQRAKNRGLIFSTRMN